MLRAASTLRTTVRARPVRHAKHWSKVREGAPRILITGCLGQIGTELARLLRSKYGQENVIATDIRKAPPSFMDEGPFKFIDVTSHASISKVRSFIISGATEWLKVADGHAIKQGSLPN